MYAQAYAFIFCLLRQVGTLQRAKQGIYMIFNVGLACHRAPLYIYRISGAENRAVAAQQTTYLSHVCVLYTLTLSEETFCWFFKLQLYGQNG